MIPLYARVLGRAFEQLPPQVRALHSVDAAVTWSGHADVTRGASIFARLIASLFRLPPEGKAQPLAVTFTPGANGAETWDRRFGSRQFLSVQSDAGNGVIAERVGAATLYLRPELRGATLTLTLTGVSCFGVPLPKALHPRVATCEFEDNGRYRFDVEAHLPLVGLLVRYDGTLSRDT